MKNNISITGYHLRSIVLNMYLLWDLIDIIYIYIPYAISSKNEYTLALSYIGHKLWNSPSPYMVDIYISINCWMT